MTPNIQTGNQNQTPYFLPNQKFRIPKSSGTKLTTEETEKTVEFLLDGIPTLEKAEKEMKEREKNKIKDFMTPEDKELMSKWEKEFPDWTKKNRNKIIFGPDYIGFEVESGKIIKLDREDLPGKYNWDDAIYKSEKLGKILPFMYEFEQMINLMPGNKDDKFKKLRELAGLIAANYWSNTGGAVGCAWYQNFTNGSQHDTNYNYDFYIRCIREN